MAASTSPVPIWWCSRAPPTEVAAHREARARIRHPDRRPRRGNGALSGGAIPRDGRHHDRLRAHEPHPRDRSGQRARRGASRAWSIWISRWRCEADGYFYAPDPSSQRACTIGGNVAENAGGPHTLAYGVTTNHVLGLEAGAARWHAWSRPAAAPDLPGYDLTGLLTGSEGTMALVTKVTVRLMRKPEMVKTVLAIYESNEDAGRTVAEITARAITPVAVEMLDGVMLRMVEEATHAGYPMDAAAVLLIELEGMREAVEEQVEQVREACPVLPARASSAWRAPPRSASCCGRAARTRSARWAASAPPITCRTAWCRAPRSRPRCSFIGEVAEQVRSDHQQHLPRRRRQHAPHHSVRPAQARRPGEGARRRRGDPRILHRRWAAPSPASTASAWRRTS